MQKDIDTIRQNLLKLILSTPTGETRNIITDISILFENIIKNK